MQTLYNGIHRLHRFVKKTNFPKHLQSNSRDSAASTPAAVTKFY